MAQALKVLVVDDQPSVVHALCVLFDVHGIPCDAATCPDEAVSKLAAADIGLVLQDMNFGAEKTSGKRESVCSAGSVKSSRSCRFC